MTGESTNAGKYSILAKAVRDYFELADANTAAGKTREQFEMSCALTQHARNRMRQALADVELSQ